MKSVNKHEVHRKLITEAYANVDVECRRIVEALPSLDGFDRNNICSFVLWFDSFHVEFITPATLTCDLREWMFALTKRNIAALSGSFFSRHACSTTL